MMVSFGHSAVGAIVGLATYHYLGDHTTVLGLVSAGGAGIVSHYVADLVPHGHFFHHREYKKKVVYAIVFDLFLSILFLAYLSFLRFHFGAGFWYILFGIGGSQLPDVLDGFFYIGVLQKKGLFKIEQDFHQWTHWHGKLDKSLMWGKRDVWQVVTALISVLLIWLW